MCRPFLFKHVTMKEIWKPVSINPEYEISTLGQLRYKGEIYDGSLGTKGYWQHSINRKTHETHRLIAKAFIKNPENKPKVNHINGVKLDNSLTNLEYVTRKENAIHAFETGLMAPPYAPWKGKFGKESPSSKIIHQYDLDGNYINTYHGTHEAIEKLVIIFQI